MHPPDSAPPPAELDARLRRLYRIYEHLRDTDLTAESRTARLLQRPEPDRLRARLADEIAELAGAADGSHRHRGLPDDAILEGSQVCYWTFVLAVAARLDYAALDPAACLSTPIPTLPGQAAARGQILARGIRSASGPVAPADLRATLRQVGRTCQALSIDPGALVDYDLAQMRARPYLAA